MKCPCGSNPSVQQITVGGYQVGISRLEEVFQSWLAAGEKAQDLTKDQIIPAIRRHNYVVPRFEDEYVEAIKARYMAYREKSPQR